ncbi:hypothetical protein HOLleu_17520 [Holothuria leucospilota]|uniref:Uncharacterized protein n=1 Tax=Holothuria leucospilota TaxID=206669 RepID=A0A9Q1H8U4_HOLLE|nr:hypothetical protein HOLleu_17520 [Holothuria leucospilota]
MAYDITRTNSQEATTGQGQAFFPTKSHQKLNTSCAKSLLMQQKHHKEKIEDIC